MSGKFLFPLVILFTGLSCSKDPEQVVPEPAGKATVSFVHLNEGAPLEFDTLMYVNAAGNPYLVNEIQYFISDLTFYRNDGLKKIIDDWKDIHYVDTDIPSSQTWEIFDPLPPGKYDSISFVFGIREEKNHSFMYVNPPERDMFWPEFLGGGYHYLKLNGKWLPEEGDKTLPFDFHLGIGQIYYQYPDSIESFVQNWFTVNLPTEGLIIAEGNTSVLHIIMNVEKWFKEPHIYDHDLWGGYIMQNQEAMQIAKENGFNVFSVQIQ
ncbi:MAG: hypothetical protein JXA03_02520 [Bacteroidales bacterium]|nr:hypothetical protein [Bacteroidales bacterium]